MYSTNEKPKTEWQDLTQVRKPKVGLCIATTPENDLIFWSNFIAFLYAEHNEISAKCE